MDCIALLEQARLLNKESKPKAALKMLSSLYDIEASNLDFILEVVTAFENLGEWGKARAMLSKGLRLYPQNCDLWIRLSNNYQADENPKNSHKALKAIDKGLFYNPENLPLLIQKSHLLANLDRVDEMRSLVDDTITRYPDEKKDLLTERASIYQLLSLHSDDEEEQVKNSDGTVYAVWPLKKAINDLNDATDCDEQDFRIQLKLARLYKQLNNFELAVFTYDNALSFLDCETEEFRISIQQERDSCLNGSSNDAEQVVDSLQEDKVNIAAEVERPLDNIKAMNLLDARGDSLNASRNDVEQVVNTLQEDKVNLAAEVEHPQGNVKAMHLLDARVDSLNANRNDAEQVVDSLQEDKVNIAAEVEHPQGNVKAMNLQDARVDSLNANRNDAEQVANTPQEGKVNIEVEVERPQGNDKARKLLDAMESRYIPAKDYALIQNNNQDNPGTKKVISITKNIQKNAREPNAGYTPTKLDKSARKFCDQVENEIRKTEFLALGDFEAKGLSQYLGKRVFKRLFVSRDSQICAAAIEIRPLKPSFITWLLLVVSRKWKVVRYVELQSETVDGIFKVTNNSGDVNPIVEDNPVKIMNIAGDSSVYDIVLTHKIRQQQDSHIGYKLIPDLKELFAFQERIRRTKNFHRETVGMVTDAKLKQLPENQFEKFSSDIKNRFSGKTNDVKSGAIIRGSVTAQQV